MQAYLVWLILCTLGAPSLCSTAFSCPCFACYSSPGANTGTYMYIRYTIREIDTYLYDRITML